LICINLLYLGLNYNKPLKIEGVDMLINIDDLPVVAMGFMNEVHDKDKEITCSFYLCKTQNLLEHLFIKI